MTFEQFQASGRDASAAEITASIGGGNVDEDGYVFVNISDPESWGLMASSGSMGVEGRDWFHVSAKAEAEKAVA